jgi:hypothetical protein
MNHRASSFRTDASRPWHRHRWPWLLMAGPLVVVVACAASAWVAVKSDDGVVAQDYYKQGLLINQKLRTAPPMAPAPGATLSVASDRGVHVRLSDATARLERLQLTFVRPSDRAHARRIDLARSGDEWVATLPELERGRWIVELASERWQLPITIVSVPFTEVTLASPHS